MATLTEELERLAGLLDRGLITREEFDQHKQQLMSGPTAGASGRPSSVGSYQVLGDIGQGGMGRVYRGRHRVEHFAERQGGDVAIKVLHAQYAERGDILERFEREAELGIRLEHPGIVRVFELISDGGRVALVMERVEGRPLSEMIGSETGPIPWPRAEALVHQMLSAVEYAHAQGVIHRDLKPENVMVGPTGKLKVLDFGIAKDVSTGRTQTGTGMGTVDYMAPEQYIDAKNVDARSDIYALGMTLYEMLAGRLPWTEEVSEFILLEAKRDGKIVPPTDFYPDIPPAIVAAVMQCLRPDKWERPTDISAMKALLDPNRVPSPKPVSSGARVSSSNGGGQVHVETPARLATPSPHPPVSSEPVERLLIEGEAFVHLIAAWPGVLRLSTTRLTFTPSRLSQTFGVQHRSILLSTLVRVYPRGLEGHLVVVQASGRQTRLSGKGASQALSQFQQRGGELCSATVVAPSSRALKEVGVLVLSLLTLFIVFAFVLGG